LSPTGTGKTILQVSICEMMKGKKILILSHTTSIINQTIKLLPGSQKIGDGVKFDGFNSNIVVSTIQSFFKIDPDEYMDYFDAFIVDEVHHVSGFDTQYAKVLKNLLSPIRLGFTATMPVKSKSLMCINGLIGGVVGQLTINEAAKLDILAKPKIKIKKLNDQKYLRNMNYKDVINNGIIHNDHRNNTILEICESHKEETVLIFVSFIEHGLLLSKLIGFPFVQGSTSSNEREDLKDKLNKKQIKGLIASTIWKEGVNIPSLNVLILACGGKSEVALLQYIGRGLRKTDDKSDVIIYDFFDPSNWHFVNHFGERISLYCENEWL
jgi:superfamily II DNA or RNA helicase